MGIEGAWLAGVRRHSAGPSSSTGARPVGRPRSCGGHSCSQAARHLRGGERGLRRSLPSTRATYRRQAEVRSRRSCKNSRGDRGATGDVLPARWPVGSHLTATGKSLCRLRSEPKVQPLLASRARCARFSRSKYANVAVQPTLGDDVRYFAALFIAWSSRGSQPRLALSAVRQRPGQQLATAGRR